MWGQYCCFLVIYSMCCFEYLIYVSNVEIGPSCHVISLTTMYYYHYIIIQLVFKGFPLGLIKQRALCRLQNARRTAFYVEKAVWCVFCDCC